MGNPITLFMLHFLAYAFVFVLIAALCVAACFVGIKWRKNKDAKAQSATEAAASIEK